jgi:hypothetical protein
MWEVTMNFALQQVAPVGLEFGAAPLLSLKNATLASPLKYSSLGAPMIEMQVNACYSGCTE